MEKNEKTLTINHIRTVISSLFCAFYAFIVIIHCFFYKTALYENLSTKPVLAQFFAFPVLFGFIGIVFSFALLVFFLYRKKRGKVLSFGLPLLCVILFVTSSFLVIAGSNAKQYEAAEHEDDTFRLVEWNTFDNLDGDSAMIIFGEYDADVVILPEFGGYAKGDDAKQRISDIFTAVGMDHSLYDVFTSPPNAGNIAPVTIVVKKTFASYATKPENASTMFGTLYLSSTSESRIDIIGLHTAPPLPSMMTLWNRDLDFVAELAKKNPDAIIIGDFNATLRHGSLNSISTHNDAVEYLSTFARGTWPIKLPTCFRASIDHILLPKGIYGIKNIETRSLSGSDHAAIFAELYMKEQ